MTDTQLNGEQIHEWEDQRDKATENRSSILNSDDASKQENAAKQAFLNQLKTDPSIMITTAGSSFEGMQVKTYLDTISTDGMVGSGIPSAVDAIAVDLSGQRSIELSLKMERAKRIAWEELLWRAHKLGADGVLGVRYDVYMPFSGVFGASVTATAVKLDR